ATWRSHNRLASSRSLWRRCSCHYSNGSFLEFAFRLGLDLGEEVFEPVEIGLPKTAIALDPFIRGIERLDLDPAGAALTVAAARDEACALQHLEMFGDRRLAHRKGPGQFHDRGFTRC